ncbi:hypothetical protein MMC25_000220, partial [Agyrium rufum]|nr:hypothetical protein [Agyrium rufum]
VGYALREPSYDGFQSDVTSNYLACNGGGNPTTPSNALVTVAAGSTVQVTWRHTLTSGSSDVIDSSHKGPVIAYLKKVSNALTDVGYGAGWFKVSQDGYTQTDAKWGVDRLIAAGGVQNVPIPSCIASGQYLLRAEIIALHGANVKGGAQFYQDCGQITVTGGSGAKTPATVSIPGTYSATDPGILISIYYPTVTNYTVPGPVPFTC